MIPFNKPYMTGRELSYIQDAVLTGKISGDGVFTKKCHDWLERKLGSGKSLLTCSCTDALEAAAILCNIVPGDEVIMPSFTFVSTANAFLLRGARIRFVDSQVNHPNMDTELIEELINERTRAIVPVHYAGMACEMDKIGSLAKEYELSVVEDAAQAIDATYKGRPLGSFGDLATFSFHETKNIISGEGGALHINRQSLVERAEIIREKGTNRSSFFRGETDKYGWVDIGSSFLPSEITAAFLLAQLESCDAIQHRRKVIWALYLERLSLLEELGNLELPKVPQYSSNNAHMFYVICPDSSTRDAIIAYLKAEGVMAVFHYQSLHSSKFYAGKHDGRALPNAEKYSDCLLRLPIFYEMTDDQVQIVCNHLLNFFGLNQR